MSSKDTNKILYGCGIGCGVLLLLFIIVVVLGYFYVADISKDFGELESSNKELAAKFGSLEESTIPLDSLEFEQKLKKFLNVRNYIAQHDSVICKEITEFDSLFISKIDSADFFESFNIVGKTTKIISVISEYMLLKNTQLLKNNLSPADYSFLYMICYYSFLNKNPGDGPAINLQNNQGFNIDFGDNKYDIEEVYDRRNFNKRIISNKLARKWLSNSLQKHSQLKDIFLDELNKCDKNHLRIIWEDEIPVPFKNVLTKYKNEIENTYNSKINFLEFVNVHKKSD